MNAFDRGVAILQYLYEWSGTTLIVVCDMHVTNFTLLVVFPIIFLTMAVVFDPRSWFGRWALILGCLIVCLLCVFMLLLLGVMELGQFAVNTFIKLEALSPPQ